ncbi:hypothetical protein EHS25_009408 [Saitozyma podzolica]|uniref:Serine dehydratase-like alpha subunit domain-containing protein n=1 Tax=Saitozyma podzolica TaxID=1890683 RepID=A0A427YLV2_9TREE|nr:hypothetical protein EHS25_009408 [Saitozyma podzolica]
MRNSLGRVLPLARQSLRQRTLAIPSTSLRAFSSFAPRPTTQSLHPTFRSSRPSSSLTPARQDADSNPGLSARAEHAVISTFDLFSIGVGPSSSHTVGPMRAAKIFVHSLPPSFAPHVHSLKVSLHGSLAATGMGHMTPHAVLLGLMGEDPQTVEVGRLGKVMDEVRAVGEVELGLAEKKQRVKFDLERDLTWHLNPLPAHPNGLRFTVFDKSGDMLATNEYFSVGGGFVVNKETQTAENLYYRDINPEHAEPSRRNQTHSAAAVSTTVPQIEAGASPESADSSTSVPSVSSATPVAEKATKSTHAPSGQPPYLFATASELHKICVEQDLTIAQVVWENELAFRSADEIREGLMNLWGVMDGCIRVGVTSTEEVLPGEFKVRRRAPGLYRRLQKGFYPTVEVATPGLSADSDTAPKSSNGKGIAKRIGRTNHALDVVPLRTTPVFPGIEYLSCMAIAVNEVNASGGRVVTAPTNGAAGVIPATLKYVTEFISHMPERDIMTFLLTASAVGMLFKRGATISAAEGGCMAEVGVACSMSAAGIAACLGAEPAVILQAAEIGIEHNLGLTCDPSAVSSRSLV